MLSHFWQPWGWAITGSSPCSGYPDWIQHDPSKILHCEEKENFLTYIFRPTEQKWQKISSGLLRCPLKSVWTLIHHWGTQDKPSNGFHKQPACHWKIGGAFVRPMGITLNLYKVLQVLNSIFPHHYHQLAYICMTNPLYWTQHTPDKLSKLSVGHD